jgi:hypothetical protein
MGVRGFFGAGVRVLVGGGLAGAAFALARMPGRAGKMPAVSGAGVGRRVCGVGGGVDGEIRALPERLLARRANACFGVWGRVGLVGTRAGHGLSSAQTVAPGLIIRHIFAFEGGPHPGPLAALAAGEGVGGNFIGRGGRGWTVRLGVGGLPGIGGRFRQRSTRCGGGSSVSRRSRRYAGS